MQVESVGGPSYVGELLTGYESLFCAFCERNPDVTLVGQVEAHTHKLLPSDEGR